MKRKEKNWQQQHPKHNKYVSKYMKSSPIVTLPAIHAPPPALVALGQRVAAVLHGAVQVHVDAPVASVDDALPSVAAVSRLHRAVVAAELLPAGLVDVDSASEGPHLQDG